MQNFINSLGWLCVAICVALIGVHGYYAFVAESAPYNVSKGHIEVGAIGLAIWFVGLRLLEFKPPQKA